MTVARPARAQDNYEISVWGARSSRGTDGGLHNNFTFEGAKTAQDGCFPRTTSGHETIESSMDSTTVRGGILYFHRRAKTPWGTGGATSGRGAGA